MKYEFNMDAVRRIASEELEEERKRAAIDEMKKVLRSKEVVSI